MDKGCAWHISSPYEEIAPWPSIDPFRAYRLLLTICRHNDYRDDSLLPHNNGTDDSSNYNYLDPGDHRYFNTADDNRLHRAHHYCLDAARYAEIALDGLV